MQIRQLLAVPHVKDPNLFYHLYEITSYYSTFWLVTQVLIKNEDDRILVKETVLNYFNDREKAIKYIGLKRRHGEALEIELSGNN